MSREYSGQAGEEYASWQIQSADEMATEVARRFAPWISPTQTVVDFGCGGGALLATLNAARKIGVEPNPSAARHAVSRGLEIVPSPHDLPDEVAEAVISHHALEHTLDPVGDLRHLLRSLRPGGVFVLIVPLDDWRSQRDYGAPDPNHHVYTWTPLSLRNLLTAAGFAVDRIDLIRMAWPPGYRTLWKWRRGRPAFDAFSALTSVLRRRRQLRAIAHKVTPAEELS